MRQKPREVATCAHEGCDRIVVGAKFCARHRQRLTARRLAVQEQRETREATREIFDSDDE